MSRLSTVDKTMLSKLLDEKCFHYLTRKSPSSKFRPSVSSSDILSIYGAGYGVSHRDIKIGDILTFSPGDGRPMVFWNILQPFEQNALVDGLACPTWHVPYTGPWIVNREYVKSEISCDNIVVTEDKNSAIKVPVMRFRQPPVSSVASVLVTHGGMDCHSVALSSFTSVEFQQYIDTWAPKWLKFLSLEWDLVQEDEPLVFVTATCSAPDYGSILFDTRPLLLPDTAAFLPNQGALMGRFTRYQWCHADGEPLSDAIHSREDGSSVEYMTGPNLKQSETGDDIWKPVCVAIGALQIYPYHVPCEALLSSKQTRDDVPAMTSLPQPDESRTQ
ncbi:hypothetical protein CPC08DRAFT_707064 [Agrocybe pediades]|nr:hypothetical protein CPC08DRAFT_707064 [Agrocybe pediades]